METIRGYKIKGRKGMSHWASIMEEWMLAIERYTRIFDGDDAPYYYNERANISVLAGAAWRAGWVALEEFQSKKGYRNKVKTNGRTDLYFANDTDEELLEAKFKWICMGSNNICRIVNKTINLAVDDAKKTRASRNDVKAIGVGFFPLYKNVNRIKDIDEQIEETIKVVSNHDFHAMGWCFPVEMRKHISAKKNIVPGIIMLAKNIDY